ncbi:MAG TPA: hypothetical protein VH333_02550 [Pseudonocardiaceae bacterium]|jgi:hypothetical protein|nr:hypothetical protein [Pseudonocardiaceae bacterium]
MTWQPWSLTDRAGLARYVTRGAQRLIDGLDRLTITAGPDGRIALARAIYDRLTESGIRYDHEPYSPADTVQSIRAPAELLGAPGRGTCLDLVLLYAGLLLDYELLPIVVVLSEHALLLVSREDGLRDWDGYRTGFAEFEHGPVTDPEVVRRLVDTGAFVPVECTGLASTSKRAPWEFDKAMAEGARRLRESRFEFAFDVAIMQYRYQIEPLVAPLGYRLAAAAEAPEYVSTHERELARLRKRSPYLFAANLSFVDPGAGHRAAPGELLGQLDGDIGILLTGPAGAGKTRTALEVATLADAAGWRVLHLRPDSKVTNEHVESAVLAQPDARTLLVMDYLELCTGLDLATLVERVRWSQPADAHFAVLAMSRPSRLPDRATRATMPLHTVELRVEAAYQEEVAAHIVRSVAPTALARLGATTMATLCGRRPIIALLIARDVEREVRRGRSPRPDGAGRAEIVHWLRRRLGPDLTDSTHPLLACAFAAAVCPLPVDRVARLVARWVDDPLSLVDDLVGMGWFDVVEDRLEVAHDIVTDQLLTEAIAPESALRVRRGELAALLDDVVAESDALDHFAGNVARMHADLPHQAKRDQLVAACTTWVGANEARLRDSFTTSPTGGHTLYTLLHSQPWQGATARSWETVVRPWLRTEVPDVDQPRFLQYALASLPDDAAQALITTTLVWLVGNTAAAEPVLGRLLRRSDLDPSQRIAAATHAKAWLASDVVAQDATVVLRALLDFATGDVDLDRDLLATVVTWAAANDTAPLAGFVLRPLLDSTALSRAQADAVTDSAVRWLDRYGAHPRSSLVLPTLLRRPDLSATQEARVVTHALAWLDLQRGHVSSTVLLRQLSAQLVPGQPYYGRLLWLLETWLVANWNSPDAELVLLELLFARDLPTETAARLVRRGLRWCADHPEINVPRPLFEAMSARLAVVPDPALMTEFAAHLVPFVVGPRNRASLVRLLDEPLHDPDRQAGVVAALLGALAGDLGRPGVPRLLQPLIGLAGAAPESRAAVFAVAGDWLAVVGDPGYPELLGWLVDSPMLAAPDAEPLLATGIHWLARCRDDPAVRTVLRRLLRCALAFPAIADQIAGAALAWVVRQPTDYPKIVNPLLAEVAVNPTVARGQQSTWLFRLRSAVGATTENPRIANAAAGLLRDWLVEHPDGPMTSDLLRVLAGGTTIDEDHSSWAARTALPLVEQRFAAGEGLRGAYLDLLSTLVGAPRSPVDVAERAARLLVRWVREADEPAGAGPALRALAGSTRCRPEVLVEALPAILAWVAATDDRAEAARLLRALVSAPRATRGAAAAALDWIAVDPGHDAVPEVLVALLGTNQSTDDPLAARGKAVARRWLALGNGDHPLAARVIALTAPAESSVGVDSLVDEALSDPDDELFPNRLKKILHNPTVRRSLGDRVAEVGLRWVAAHPRHQRTAAVLQAMADSPRLSKPMAEAVVTAALRWIDSTPNSVATARLLRLSLQGARVSADLTRQVGTRCLALLGDRLHTEADARIAAALVSAARASTEHADVAAGLILNWLTDRDVDALALNLIGRILSSTRLGQPAVDRAGAIAARWVNTRPGRWQRLALAKTVINTNRTAESTVDAMFRALLDRITANPTEPQAPQGLRMLVVAQRPSLRCSDDARIAAVDWARANGNRPAALDLVSALIRHQPTYCPTWHRIEALVEEWHRARPANATVAGLRWDCQQQAPVLLCAALLGEPTESTVDAALNWISDHPADPAAIDVRLAVVAAGERLSADTAPVRPLAAADDRAAQPQTD